MCIRSLRLPRLLRHSTCIAGPLEARWRKESSQENDVATDDEQWGAKFKVLKENVEHHIQEEESEMFRTARGIFSRAELQDLAQRMVALTSRSGGAPRRAKGTSRSR